MPIQSRMLTVSALILAVAAASTGCGGGDADPATSPAPAPTAQTITFGSPGPKTSGTTSTLTASSSSNLAVTFSSTTPNICTVTGTTLSLLATGDCTVAANQAGNATYAAAPEVSRTFAVGGLMFSSGYTQFQETAPGSNYYEGGTAEGGKIGFFNGGFDPALVYNQTLFTGGGYTDQNPNPVPAADSFYYIAVTYASPPTGGYLGAYSQYPGSGLQLQQQTKLRVDVAVDDGHFKQQANKDFRVEITAGTTFNNGNCKPMVSMMVTPQQAAMYTYRLRLADFAVAQDCGQANLTAAQILAMPIKEISALYAYPNLNDSTNVNQYGGRGTAITRGTTSFE